MRRFIWPLIVVLLLSPAAVLGQAEQHIKNALSAAPASIAGDASVMDGGGNVLREGSNGWTCMPDNPEVEGNGPMCLDDQWMRFVHAWLNNEEPTYDHIGFGYMLAGGEVGSNVDPYADGPTADNEWMSEPGPPHLMMVVPNAEWLVGLPTKPEGGPWVMWKDSPLVHVMIPTAGGSH